MTNQETWIIYKTETMSDHGWRERYLMPSKSITNILHEEWSSKPNKKAPLIGSRFRNYTNLEDPGNGITHGCDGDWVVTRTQEYSADDDSGDRVIICYCSYQPITPNWQKLKRVKPPVAEPV